MRMENIERAVKREAVFAWTKAARRRIQGEPKGIDKGENEELAVVEMELWCAMKCS